MLCPKEDPDKVYANDLGPEHLDKFTWALYNILSTDLAEHTFAQIIDGLPTRDDIGADFTQVNAKVAQAYQDALPGSKDFNMRLLEVLAVTCHDIAALLHANTEPGLRQEGQDAETRKAALESRPTDFMHEDYDAWEQYPQGIADVVGYWAEYHLFGGVVLFDREILVQM
ncbi:hypothetical protein H2199_004840 [Coniosporium tulheliwenetii]|uniref:Uncharacterized protein n=1 Tax=Coniosporium tulheliwenetii TaxID=3383036 RepID=A0ACC2Z404_9PEZI|nr:hypothetical protein H2199_004840 [Cladosporium sp. JES 115]